MNQTLINHSINLRSQHSHSKNHWNQPSSHLQFSNQNDKESKQLLKYLNSQQSQIIQSPNKAKPIHNPLQEIQQKYYLICPQLYESYRNEHCTQQINGINFHLKKYNKGRNELRFATITEIQLPNIAKLTIWQNGDYKLIYNEQVYFWHEDKLILDKYCVTI